jgi:TetR/AcrR family transcriptional regulator, regulator of autoinduction and epiphytic fitness
MRNVKSPAGSIRAERAAVTSRRILDAARRRFGDAGYAATTLREIASEAGVAVQTVYAVFGSKANILRALRASVVTDPAASEAYTAALAATARDEALASFARSIRLRWEAGHDIVMIDSNAAAADPDVRREVEAANAMRRGGIARLARRLDELERGLDPRRVEALLDALTLTSVYERLVSHHGWSCDAYEEWLADTLRRDLRGPTTGFRPLSDGERDPQKPGPMA